MLAELRYSARGLARTPALTVALLLTIALGIGGNAMVSGFIRGSLQRRVAVPEPDRAWSLFSRDAAGGFVALSPSEFARVKAATPSFAALGAMRESQAEVRFDGRASLVSAGEVTPELLTALGVSATSGVIVSRRLWRVEFGAPGRFVGQPLTIDDQPVPIGGFMPEEFTGLFSGRDIDVWLPLDEASLADPNRQGHTLWTVGRLRAGATAAEAQAEITAALGGDGRVIAVPYTGIEPDVAGGLAEIGKALPLAALGVFFVACANVASFLLSRATSRAHETSVRIAIGADRRDIARQLLMDAGLIAVAGTAAGALLALWTSRFIPALFFDQDATALSFSPNIPAIAGACALCAAITIVCGLVPLFEVRDDDPAAVLRREAGGLSNAARRARSALVVAQMACSCLLLIATGLLIAGFRVSLRTTIGNQLGQPLVATVTSSGGFGLERRGGDFFAAAERTAMETPGVVSAAWVSALPGSRPAWQALRLEPIPTSLDEVTWRMESYPPPPPAVPVSTTKAGRLLGGRDTPDSCPAVVINEAAAAFFEGSPVGRLIEDPARRRLEVVGIIAPPNDRKTGQPPSASVYYYREQADPPLPAGTAARFRIPGWSAPIERATLDANVVSPDYFNAVGARVTSGTTFPANLISTGCRVAIINAEAEQQFFGGKAVGRVLLNPAGHRIEIIGVVSTPPLRVSQRVIEPAIFFPMAQNFLPRMTLLLGTSGPVDRIASSVRRRLALLPGQLVPPRVLTLEQHLSWTSLAAERIATTLIGVCAALALVLAMMGVYGAMADAVVRRRRELALRIALGSQAWRLVRHVIWEGARLAVAGALAGGIAAAALERWGLETPAAALVWPVWVAAPATLAFAVLVAAVLPARRAVRADPITLMKDA